MNEKLTSMQNVLDQPRSIADLVSYVNKEFQLSLKLIYFKNNNSMSIHLNGHKKLK